MKKKWLKLTFLLILPLVIGLACQVSNPLSQLLNKPTEEELVYITTEEPDVVATEADETDLLAETLVPATGDELDLVMLDEDFWTQEDGSVYLAFYFQNPNVDILFEDIDYTIYLYDADGNEVQTYDSFLRYLFPQETFGLSEIVYLDDETVTVDSIEIEWTYLSGAAEDFVNPFTAEDITYWENEGWPMVTAKVYNGSSDTYTYILANVVCLDNSDQIVGSGYSTIQFVPGNDYMGFSSYVDVFGDVSRCEVFPTYTYSSTYYEGEDFWSEVAILEDNFFLDDYGYILGGMTIQNNIDVPLSNSIAYVTFYDDNGAVTATAEYNVELLLAGETLGISPWASTPPVEAETTTYDILVLPGDYEDDYELTENPFVINSTEITGDYEDYVTVKFTNGYSKSVTEVNVNVLIYDTDGYIIGGGYSWFYDPIAAGDSAEIEIWVDYDQYSEIGAITAWVSPSYWTEFK
ncbi:MAG: hypothetical protein H0S79_19695 [Anaerolineaceae bacterium]|nr:hypothetical protein [Anaerolineaceae bacterium]